MLDVLKQHRTIVILVILGLSFFFRASHLGAAGLSEDEARKVDAGRAYLRGDFFVNLEHPMLMKEMIALSMTICDRWNGFVNVGSQVSDEVAVRLPNLVFGSLTAIVIFLIAEEMFGFTVGLFSGLLWSTAILSIAINRVAKEETMLVFFNWLGFYLYMKAKNLGSENTTRQKRFYGLSGVSFGLMLASKYLPHYFGLNMLYYHMVGSNKKNQPVGRSLILILGAMVLTFLMINPVVLSPAVLKYFVGYVQEQTMTHHGYYMMSHLYWNDFLYRPGSTPVYYYVLLLFLKTPLPVLGALLLGLLLAFRRRKDPKHFFLLFMFLWWIIPFSLSGGKFLRYSLSAMPTVCIISALGVVKVLDLLSAPLKGRLTQANFAMLGVAVLALFFAIPLVGALRSAPFYSLYLNPLGSGRAAYYFPHDEIYDAGLRETIREICDTAPPGARVGGESPAVFKYYLAKFGRPDLVYFNLSDPADHDSVGQTYVVVQDGRKYFENIDLIVKLEAFSAPVRTVRVGPAIAAKVYSVNDLPGLRMSDQEMAARPVESVTNDPGCDRKPLSSAPEPARTSFESTWRSPGGADQYLPQSFPTFSCLANSITTDRDSAR